MPKRSKAALIAVIHLPPLPGAPTDQIERGRSTAASDLMNYALEMAVKEAALFEKVGFDGIIIENFGDQPFYKDHVPPETIAAMSVVATAVGATVKVPVGINVLRNDARAGLAVAAASAADFIRVNVLSGVAASDQGFLEGQAATVLRDRARLQAEVGILADVHVKHAVPISSGDLVLAIEETGLRARADGVILSGAATGRLADVQEIQIASQTCRSIGVPLYLGSGASSENVGELVDWVDGIIVSSDLRQGGEAGQTLDRSRIRRFLAAAAGQAKPKNRAAKKKSKKKSKKKAAKKPAKKISKKSAKKTGTKKKTVSSGVKKKKKTAKKQTKKRTKKR